jgi:tripartite-type tricarboxylate transporter receptor subunit TctC
MKKQLLVLALLTTAPMLSSGADAQNWPTKPVRFIVSQAAGGTPDIICRILTDRLSQALGQQFVVENRPGGANIVGAQTVAHAVPDGYTFFFATAAALVSNPYTFKSLPYDPKSDFVPVGMIAKNPFFMLAHPSVKAATLTELIALEKANPGKLTYATDGPRNFSGILAAWINKLAGVNILQVPYATMPQGIQDAIAGRVQLVILAPASAAPFITRGDLRPLAVSSAQRVPGYDKVPSIAETLPSIELTGWFAIVGPRGTPSDIIARLNSALDRILKEPAVAQKLAGLGFYTEGADTLEGTGSYIRSQLETWGKVTRDIGLEPE